jgi:hypothetical protein
MTGCTPCCIIPILHSWKDLKLLIKLTEQSSMLQHCIMNESVVNGFKVLFISFCSLAACLVVTAKLYFEQETVGTATIEFAELQVR